MKGHMDSSTLNPIYNGPASILSRYSATEEQVHMLSDTDTPLEFMDLLLDRSHPVAWTVNKYPRPTGRHFDIHAGLEIGVVLSGRSRRLYRDYQSETRAGDLWLIAPWEPHGVQI